MQSNVLSTVLFITAAAAVERASVSPRQSNGTTVPSRVESGINTECKTCPYSLCTNKDAYDSGLDLTLTCWTTGDTIVDTDTWYETTDGCYVTEWDVVEGNYTSELSYCGDIAETYTQGPGKTVYNTECNIIPDFVEEKADHTKMYQPEVDLTLTCYTLDGASVLGNSKWYKTLSNCYVPAAEIEPVDEDLDDCGPIPFLEAKMRQPDPEPSATADAALRVRAAEDALHKRWLYLTQVGEDEADCLSEADSTSDVETTYEFGQYLTIQCATYSKNAADDNQIYLLTDQFCWVNDTLTDPQLIDDEQRAEDYPNCDDFVDTEV